MAGIGTVDVGLNNVAFTFGVSMITASDTALIYAGIPIWGILLGLAFGLEKPSLWYLFGLILAFLGVGMVVYEGLGVSGGTSLAGDLFVVLATMCWGSYAVLSLPILKKYSLLVVAAYTMLFGGLAVIPFALPGFVDAEWHRMGAVAWAALAYSTLFVASVGFYAWQRGVSEVGANRVLAYQNLVTLVGVARWPPPRALTTSRAAATWTRTP